MAYCPQCDHCIKLPPRPPCVECGAPLRTRLTPNAQSPEARVHAGLGLCPTCYARKTQRPSGARPNVRPCEGCGVETRPGARSDLAGAPRGNRDLCRACYQRTMRSGTAERRRPTSELLEDFDFLIETTGGVRADTRLGWDAPSIHRVAERLGVNPKTLSRTLYRHRSEQPSLVIAA